ncbi:MAG: hypothetical protein K0Q68_266 [Moraxellaceae bacterium]|jgi:hypothetical protein|nr:hypothetical protein [Moraxellaceae bacterium]
MKSLKNYNFIFPEFLSCLWRWRLDLYAVLAMAIFYGFIINLIHGDGEWIYVDYVAKSNIFWGDDSYRWFLARSAWINPDVYWFNFALPVWTFLDGVVATLSRNDLLHARYIKGALSATSIFLFYRTCLKLELSRWSALSAAFLLATMPLYFLVGMSFYGESWLLVLMAVSMYCHVHGFKRLFLLAIAVMPLVRPEGFVFVLVFSAILIYQKKWKEVLVLVSFGSAFFVSIFFFSDISSFFNWRIESREVYQRQGTSYGWAPGNAGFFDIFPPPLLIPAFLGVLMAKGRSLSGFYLGAVLVVVYWVVSISGNRALAEPRYFVVVMPVLLLAFATFLDQLPSLSMLKKRSAGVARGLAVVSVIAVFFCNFYSLTVVRMVALQGLKDGKFLTYMKDWDRGGKFFSLSLEEKYYYKEYADVATRMLQLNPDIKTLYIGNVQTFYFLDPHKIPKDVRVVFAVQIRRNFFGVLAENETAGYFSSPPYYGYFNMTDPTYEREKILYLDYFPGYENYPYRWRVGGSRLNGPNDIFLFGGHFLGVKKIFSE